MAIDMSLTLNALTAKSSGKDVRRTAESQPARPQQSVGQVDRKQPVEKATQTERFAAAPANVQKKELDGAVKQMKDFAQMLNRELQFDVDDELGQTVVRVVDKESGELIRQIPSDEILELAKQMQEMRETEDIRLEGRNTRQQPVGLFVKIQA